MFHIPAAAEPLTRAIRQSNVFSRPTFDRFMALMAGLIVTMGRRTVSHSLVAIGPIVRGHWSNYHRIYSQSKFSMWSLAAVLVRQVVALLPKDAIIELVADDTVDGKGGTHVWAKSAHRDPVRSNSHGRTTIKYGHKWLARCACSSNSKVGIVPGRCRSSAGCASRRGSPQRSRSVPRAPAS